MHQIDVTVDVFVFIVVILMHFSLEFSRFFLQAERGLAIPHQPQKIPVIPSIAVLPIEH